MRIVFMGTPDFSAPILEALQEKYEVVLVVTQPDKLVGRRQTLSFSPVKEMALKHQIPVFQPVKIKDDFNPIIEAKPDVIITAAYGQLVPKTILDLPRFKCINIHASLLPKYRGGAPIHRAIINGETKTGVSIMYMAPKMDSGDILYQEELDILECDNVGTLFDKLSALAVNMIIKFLPNVFSGNIEPLKQDEDKVVFAYNITREEEKINLNQNAKDVYNQIRGLNPWPVAYLTVSGIAIKVFEASYTIGDYKGVNGEVLALNKTIDIKVNDGIISLKEIQVSGKKRCRVIDFLNGQHVFALGNVVE